MKMTNSKFVYILFLMVLVKKKNTYHIVYLLICVLLLLADHETVYKADYKNLYRPVINLVFYNIGQFGSDVTSNMFTVLEKW
jgi:hypothetical protein